MIRLDATIQIAHSDKEGAAGTFKGSWGHHSLTGWCDNTNESLAFRLRPGNAGSNTASDHIEVLGEAIAQVPAAPPRPAPLGRWRSSRGYPKWICVGRRTARVLYVGDDWAEDHHDVEIQDQTGRRLSKARLPEGLAGVARLHELIAEQLAAGGGADVGVEADAGPEQVLVGIETDRGPWVQALVAAGYRVYPINPRQVARYRERHANAGAKSDVRDAHTLADMVRTDGHQLRPMAGDSPSAAAVKVLARAHQTLVAERVRHQLRLRSALREYFPAALEAFDDSPPRMRWSCWAGPQTPGRRPG